jgi:hypothetical protein
MAKFGRPKKPPSLTAFGFSDDTIEQIQDLSEGWIGAPPHRVIAQALRHFINDKGISAEPEVQLRYNEARAKRQADKQSST